MQYVCTECTYQAARCSNTMLAIFTAITGSNNANLCVSVFGVQSTDFEYV